MPVICVLPAEVVSEGGFKAAGRVKLNETSDLPLSVSAETHHPFTIKFRAEKLLLKDYFYFRIL